MPTGKKKRKSAVNPGRGFATQSVASKVKDANDDSISEPTTSKERNEKDDLGTTSESHAFVSNGPDDRNNGDETRDLHELSPEELEQRLEQTELQELVESIGPKVFREAARQSSKLQADCRVLRPQAQALSMRLVQPNIMSQMFSLVEKQQIHDAVIPREVTRKPKFSEREILLKVWTLQRVLLASGFTESHVEHAIQHVVRYVPAKDSASYIWGLKESLEWLVLTLTDEELPVIDSATGKPVEKPSVEAEKDAASEDQFNDTSKNDTSPDIQSSKAPSNGLNAGEVDVPPSKEYQVSDLEDDLDPQEMISVYLRTKARLYELRPELIEPPSKRSKSQLKPLPLSPAIQSAVARLQNKLKKISFDLLFDQDEAERQWQEQRNLIAKEQATRRKLQLPESKSQETALDPKSNSRPHEACPEASNTESDSDTALGDLFAVESNGGTAESANAPSNELDPSVMIRDFGITKGIDPRRVLEDACHARDSAVKLNYKVISSTAFSIRYSLRISWSKKQAVDRPLDLAAVPSSLGPSRASFSMKSIATPERQQSQAYISVVALFQIFSTSSKEDKVYLRLPPTWRDLYSELVQLQALQAEAAQRVNIRRLRELVREAIADDEDQSDDDVVLTRNFRKRNEQNRSGSASPALANGLVYSGEEFKNLWASRVSTPAFQRMLQHRKGLPIHAFKDEALSTIEKNQVTIICGETGCGKSTQIPAYLLERELSEGRPCKIYCTEPRRISAITLAQRVSEELGESRRDLGTNRSLVGYAIRLESRFTPSTRLVFATTGILLRMLESPEGTSEITHLVIDEVHERSIETDFLLIILGKLRLKRPELRIVLMSATVDASRFSGYFGGAPVLDVPGRTFPVESLFLEDAIESTSYSIGEDEQYIEDAQDIEIDEADHNASTPTSPATTTGRYSPKTLTTLAKLQASRIPYLLIVKLISYIISARPQFARAMLVFLPGLSEIRRLASLLSSHPGTSTYQIHALHSTISSEEQQAAFQLPSYGFRGKIVLSTNIAETGVTIPDITCVIDTGKHKEMRFDERRQISRLIEVFISRANAKQRRGRAGRVQDSLCYHLFSRERHDLRMPEAQTPEILRLSLQDLIMRVKICKLGDIRSTLSSALDAPLSKNIERAIDALIEVGALSKDEELTPLGQELSKLPLDPYLGKLVLHGAQFGCLDAALTIAAILTAKSPFVTTAEGGKATDNVRQAFAKGDSDLLTEYNVYSVWKRICTNPNPAMSEQQFCKRNMLSIPTLSNIEDLKFQLFSALQDAGCLPFPSTSFPSTNGDSRDAESVRSRNRRFLASPPHLTIHNHCTDLLAGVIATSFHPKILARDFNSPKGGWRNIGTNQAVSIHPSSIYRMTGSGASGDMTKTRGADRLLSFYSILQTSGGAKNYNANSLTPVSPMLLLLLAGSGAGLETDVNLSADIDSASFHPLAQVITLDAGGSGGQKLRYKLQEPELGSSGGHNIGADKQMLCLKYLRRALSEITQKRWKHQNLGSRLEAWWELWEGLVRDWEGREGRQ